MALVLVRHADAVHAEDPVDDSARWLSGEGRQRARTRARRLAALGLAVDRMLTSPRVRAVQTAELFAQELGFDAPIEVLPSLCYTVPARVAVRALSALPGTTVAFGHMPTLAEMVQQLTGEARPRSLATASVVVIEAGRVERVIDGG
jgi:phosphohistidine phosphatase